MLEEENMAMVKKRLYLATIGVKMLDMLMWMVVGCCRRAIFTVHPTKPSAE